MVDAVERHEVLGRVRARRSGCVLDGHDAHDPPLSAPLSMAIRCASGAYRAPYGRHRPADRCAAAAGRAALVPEHRRCASSLSAPAVKRRVDRLEADGVIRGYTARVDPGRVGWHTHAFVALYCEGRMAAAEVRDAVERHPEVEAAYTVAGEASAILHVRARDTAHLEEALERIRDTPGVTPHADAGRALDAVRAPGRRPDQRQVGLASRPCGRGRSTSRAVILPVSASVISALGQDAVRPRCMHACPRRRRGAASPRRARAHGSSP